MALDRVDQTLLELLQKDGRTSAQALSEAVNLSARATLNRIHKLEDDGHIEGYRALLARHGLVVVDVEEWPTHGGSLRVFARHDREEEIGRAHV